MSAIGGGGGGDVSIRVTLDTSQVRRSSREVTRDLRGAASEAGRIASEAQREQVQRSQALRGALVGGAQAAVGGGIQGAFGRGGSAAGGALGVVEGVAGNAQAIGVAAGAALGGPVGAFVGGAVGKGVEVGLLTLTQRERAVAQAAAGRTAAIFGGAAAAGLDVSGPSGDFLRIAVEQERRRYDYESDLIGRATDMTLRQSTGAIFR